MDGWMFLTQSARDFSRLGTNQKVGHFKVPSLLNTKSFQCTGTLLPKTNKQKKTVQKP